MTTVQGKTIFESFVLASRVGSELEGLHDTLSNLLISSLGADKTLLCKIASAATNESRWDDSGWVCTDFAWSLPLKASGKGSSKPKQYFGYQISMAGDGTAIAGYSEPLLHMFSWGGPIQFDEDSYVGFPLDERNGDSFDVVDSRLLVWGGLQVMDWNKRAWTYSLRLTALNSPDDLKKYIVMPALALLKGADAVSALPDNFFDSVLVRYPAKEELLVL